jgi:hypothetical protein
MRTTMMQVEIYHGHAGLFHQMANHIELSMMPQHRRENGGPDPITTNDVTLATTLFNSIFGYPAGKEAVLALSAGLIPGEERSQSVCGLFMMTVGCSEYDQTVKYTILPLPGQEMETAKLLKAAAAYSLERAEAHSRNIPLPIRVAVQLER